MAPMQSTGTADEDERRLITELFLKYQRLMYRQIRRIVGDDWAAEDLLQDVLVKLMEKAPALLEREDSRRVLYLVAVCRNRARNYLRDRRRRGRLFLAEMSAQPDADADELERRLIFQERLERLDQVWGRLDRRSRFVLSRYYLFEQSTREIGRQMGLSPGGVRMALSRARRRAQALMDQEERLPRQIGSGDGKSNGEKERR